MMMNSMKDSVYKQIILLPIIMGIASTLGCGSLQEQNPGQASAKSPPPSPSLVTPKLQSQTPALPKQQSSSPHGPAVGTVEKMENGDLMCYVTVVDENNIRHENLGADFELCANADQYLKQKVKLTYQQANVSDCQSAEPCGKSRKEWLITTMDHLD
jgi:hypothetical protein